MRKGRWGTKAMIKREKRQKEQHLFLIPFMSWYIDVLHSIGIQSYKKCLLSEGCLFTRNSLFSASNTDSSPTTVNISRLRHSLSLLHTYCSLVYIHVTLPRQLFCSCCVGAVDLRQSKALLTDSLSLSLIHTLALTHTHTHNGICQLVCDAQLTDSE